MKMDENINFVGDNLIENLNDYKLFGSQDLLQKINALPSPDNIDFCYSQMKDKKYFGSCTRFNQINATASNFNYSWSQAEIWEFEQYCYTLGARPNEAWSRSEGANAMRKFWNSKHPDQQVDLFLIDLFSQEFFALLKKGWLMSFSIRVGNDFIIDCKDGKISGNAFSKSYGHAIAFQGLQNILGRFMDSADWNKNNRYEIGENLKNLVKNGNVIGNAHVLLPQKYNFLENEATIELLKTSGYTDGNNLQENMTIEQALVLTYRVEKRNPKMDYNVALEGGKKYLSNPKEDLSIGVTRDKLAWILSKMSNISYENLITRGVWSGNNAQNIATRFEGLLMIGRVYKILNG